MPNMREPSSSLSPSYVSEVLCSVPGTVLRLDVKSFHVVGSPMRLARFVRSLILEEEAGGGVSDAGGDEASSGERDGGGGGGGSESKDSLFETKTMSMDSDAGRSNRAAASIVASLMKDLQGKHMLFQFSFETEVVVHGSAAVHFLLRQTKEEEVVGGKDVSKKKNPTFVFQNVYFVKDVIKMLNTIAKSLSEDVA